MFTVATWCSKPQTNDDCDQAFEFATKELAKQFMKTFQPRNFIQFVALHEGNALDKVLETKENQNFVDSDDFEYNELVKSELRYQNF